MTTSKNNSESWLLIAIIIFGIAVPLMIELSLPKYTVRPLLILLIMGVSFATLIYKYLGGFEDSEMNTPIYKLGGTAVFLFAFIWLCNPILEKQTIPQKGELFQPSAINWIPVLKENLMPIDTLKLKFMGYDYSSKEFGEYKSNKNLYFNIEKTEGEENLNIFQDQEKESKLGQIEVAKIIGSLGSNSSISIINQLVILDRLYVGKGTDFDSLSQFEKSKYKKQSKDLTWFPYHIKPISFGSGSSEYQIIPKGKVEKVDDGSIQVRGSNIHVINHRIFLIMVHSVNHEASTKYASFAVFELGSNNEIKVK